MAGRLIVSDENNNLSMQPLEDMPGYRSAKKTTLFLSLFGGITTFIVVLLGIFGRIPIIPSTILDYSLLWFILFQCYYLISFLFYWKNSSRVVWVLLVITAINVAGHATVSAFSIYQLTRPLDESRYVRFLVTSLVLASLIASTLILITLLFIRTYFNNAYTLERTSITNKKKKKKNTRTEEDSKNK